MSSQKQELAKKARKEKLNQLKEENKQKKKEL